MNAIIFRCDGSINCSAKGAWAELRRHDGGAIGLHSCARVIADRDRSRDDFFPPLRCEWNEIEEWPSGHCPKPDDPIRQRIISATLRAIIPEIGAAIYLEDANARLTMEDAATLMQAHEDEGFRDTYS